MKKVKKNIFFVKSFTHKNLCTEFGVFCSLFFDLRGALFPHFWPFFGFGPGETPLLSIFFFFFKNVLNKPNLAFFSFFRFFFDFFALFFSENWPKMRNLIKKTQKIISHFFTFFSFFFTFFSLFENDQNCLGFGVML